MNFFNKNSVLSRYKVKSFHKKRKKSRIAVRIAVTLFIVAAALLFVDSRMKPLVKESGQNALRNRLTVLLNESVDKAIATNGTQYSDFVHLEKDARGNIRAVVCDTRYINSFQQVLSDDAADNVAQNGTFSIKIPLGTLLDSELFSGRGPRITLSATAYGFAVTNVFSSVESVAINQTVHRISARVTLSASARVGTHRVSETVEEIIPIAETVIVGEVPQMYVEPRD